MASDLNISTGTKTEYERKFLLKRKPRKSADRVLNIVNYYTATDVFYRRIEDENEHITYWKISKTDVGDSSNIEFEQIAEDKFHKKRSKAIKRIAKIRYMYYDGPFTWEVDVFGDMQLVVAEVEIDDRSLASSHEMPSYISRELIVEVTNIQQFKSKQLAGTI